MQQKAIDAGLALTLLQFPQDMGSYATVPITDSFKQFLNGVYGLFHRRYYRAVAHTLYGQEVVDESVKQRLTGDPYYRPKNAGLRERA